MKKGYTPETSEITTIYETLDIYFTIIIILLVNCVLTVFVCFARVSEALFNLNI